MGGLGIGLGAVEGLSKKEKKKKESMGTDNSVVIEGGTGWGYKRV